MLKCCLIPMMICDDSMLCVAADALGPVRVGHVTGTVMLMLIICCYFFFT